ncbi:MAG: hypothetical protein ABJA10_10115 [Aestuariivirga sp.]
MVEDIPLRAMFLNATEEDVMNATLHPAIGQLSDGQLKILGRRLRQAHIKSRDISNQQKREMRGKAEARGAMPARDNPGSVAKTQLLRDALTRVQFEVDRRMAKPSQAELSHHAVELKLNNEAPKHPGAGPPTSHGMKAINREKPFKIGPPKSEVGRVTQAGKVAQARRDGNSR